MVAIKLLLEVMVGGTAKGVLPSAVMIPFKPETAPEVLPPVNGYNPNAAWSPDPMIFQQVLPELRDSQMPSSVCAQMLPAPANPLIPEGSWEDGLE
jgi:hypothetical protein